MGVAALGIIQNETIAGDQLLRSKIRSELGGAPTTMLHSQNETVGNFYRKNGKDNSSTRENRNSLNSTVLVSNSTSNKNENGPELNSTELNKKRVCKKLLQRFRSTRDGIVKKKIKYCMKELNCNENKNSMINIVFELNSNDKTSFSSFDVADELINFVEDSDVEK